MNCENYSCPICLIIWDQSIRIPRILPQCGHTICTECLKGILKTSQPSCPFDKTLLPFQNNGLAPFPINYAVKQLLEEREIRGICQEHGEDLVNFCLTDKVKICNECSFDGKHKGHEIQTVKRVKLEADAKMKDLNNLRVALETSYLEMRKDLQKRKDQSIRFVKSTFDRMRLLLFQKEDVLVNEITISYIERIDHLDKMLGTHSPLNLSTKKKISDLALDFESGNFLSFKNENVIELDSFIENFLAKCREEINLEDEKLFQESLNLGLAELRSFVEKTSFSYQLTKQESSSQTKGEAKEIPENLSLAIDELEIQSNLSLEFQNHTLKLSVNEGEAKTLSVGRKALEKINEVQIVFFKNNISKNDRAVLGYIWENIDQLKILKITFLPNLLTDDIFLDLLPILFNKIEEVGKLILSLGNSMIGDNSFIVFLEKFFVKVNELEGLFLDLESTEITQRSLVALEKYSSKFRESLTAYQLYLNNNELSDEDLMPIFFPLPNVKIFHLSLTKTKITENFIKAFAKVLHGMENLEVLELYFGKTLITIESIIEMFKNIRNVQTFYLDLDDVKMDDHVLIEFEDKVVSRMKNLKEVFLNLNRGVSKDGFTLIQKIHFKYPYTF